MSGPGRRVITDGNLDDPARARRNLVVVREAAQPVGGRQRAISPPRLAGLAAEKRKREQAREKQAKIESLKAKEKEKEEREAAWTRKRVQEDLEKKKRAEQKLRAEEAEKQKEIRHFTTKAAIMRNYDPHQSGTSTRGEQKQDFRNMPEHEKSIAERKALQDARRQRAEEEQHKEERAKVERDIERKREYERKREERERNEIAAAYDARLGPTSNERPPDSQYEDTLIGNPAFSVAGTTWGPSADGCIDEAALTEEALVAMAIEDSLQNSLQVQAISTGTSSHPPPTGEQTRNPSEAPWPVGSSTGPINTTGPPSINLQNVTSLCVSCITRLVEAPGPSNVAGASIHFRIDTPQGRDAQPVTLSYESAASTSVARLLCDVVRYVSNQRLASGNHESILRSIQLSQPTQLSTRHVRPLSLKRLSEMVLGEAYRRGITDPENVDPEWILLDYDCVQLKENTKLVLELEGTS